MGSQIISNKIHSDGIFDIYKRRKVVFIPKNPLNLDWIVLSNSSITRHHCACWWHRFPFNSSTIISDIYELFVSYVRLMAASTSNSWSTIVPTCDYTSYDSSFFLIFFFFFFFAKTAARKLLELRFSVGYTVVNYCDTLVNQNETIMRISRNSFLPCSRLQWNETIDTVVCKTFIAIWPELNDSRTSREIFITLTNVILRLLHCSIVWRNFFRDCWKLNVRSSRNYSTILELYRLCMSVWIGRNNETSNASQLEIETQLLISSSTAKQNSYFKHSK